MNFVDIAMNYAFCFVGTWYKWGGDDPSGFDCSGFVCEVLKAVGIIGKNEDLSAARLFDTFPKVDTPMKGCLVFWGNPVHHVEFIFNDSPYQLCIGASGGDSKTLTVGDAIKQNAYIKLRPVRPNVTGYVDPFSKYR
jgi:hypothetical protein